MLKISFPFDSFFLSE